MRHQNHRVSLLLGVALFSRYRTSAFTVRPSHSIGVSSSKSAWFRRQYALLAPCASISGMDGEESAADTDEGGPPTSTPLLADTFPDLASSLSSLGISVPTPIQHASADMGLAGDNLLLIAPTGSGKTLAYLLPAISKAMEEDGTVLMVAPTRELAVQLMRDSVALLSGITDDPEACVLLSVKGVAMPNASQLGGATVIIGTPSELYDTLTIVGGGFGFIAGDTLSAVILDEVDILLPPAAKGLRTALDRNGSKKMDRGRISNSAQEERRKREQKRKVLAAKRRGVQVDDAKRVMSDTERILGLVASCRMSGEEEANPAQVFAGSATASRKALDRLNKALRLSAKAAALPFELAWSSDVKICRPAEKVLGTTAGDISHPEKGSNEQHTIRAVTVPNEVKHRYIELSKEAASDPAQVLSALAEAASEVRPETALIFLCGEFGKQNKADKTTGQREIRGATSKARRNAQRKQRANSAKAVFKQTNGGKKQVTGTSGLSARKVCSMLSNFDLQAQPLHVALGLELNAKEGEDTDETPPYLVTFEGSARGLHFDEVDVVFVVGRPASAASYLHLAGRVGRSSADRDGNIVVRPGTVISVCTKGSATELEKWTKQIGGSELKRL